MIGAVLIDRFARHGRGGKCRQLALHFLRYLRGEPLRGGQQDRAGVDIVLGLREHVGGEESADRPPRR